MKIHFISIIIPIFIIFVFITAFREKVDILKLFTDGVLQGLKTILIIFPYIFSITIAITLLQETGLINHIIAPFSGILIKLGIPKEIITLSIFRPLSGGASTSIVMDIFKRYGVDSIQGKIASILMGSTETTFYVTTIMFGAINIKKTRGTIIAAIAADITAIIVTIIIVNCGFA